MAICTSTQAINEIRTTMCDAVRNIEAVQSELTNMMSVVSDWNDSQGEQFRMLMRSVARCTEEPKNALKDTLPRLERMAEAIERYNKVRF